MSKYTKEEVTNRLLELSDELGRQIRKEDIPRKDLGIPSYNTCMRLGIVLKKINDSIKQRQFDLLDLRCLHCHTKLTIEQEKGKFCSSSCSAKHSKGQKPKTDKTKENISKALKKYYTVRKVTPVPCVICEEYHVKQGKTCSPSCTAMLISDSVKTAHKEGRHLGNRYRSRDNPSYLERSFREWLDENIHIEYETEKAISTYIDSEYHKTFYIDFFFPKLSLGIELDGTQHKDTVEYDRHRDELIHDQYGIDIVRISYEEYVNKTRVDEITERLTSSK